MPITLARIDQRLIHGITVNQFIQKDLWLLMMRLAKTKW